MCAQLLKHPTVVTVRELEQDEAHIKNPAEREEIAPPDLESPERTCVRHQVPDAATISQVYLETPPSSI